MKAIHKKVIAYVVCFSYLTMCFSILFLSSDFKIGNSLLFWLMFILLFPGLFISFIFGFFGGTKWAIFGAILTILISIFIIERFFKRHKHRKIEKYGLIQTRMPSDELITGQRSISVTKPKAWPRL